MLLIKGGWWEILGVEIANPMKVMIVPLHLLWRWKRERRQIHHEQKKWWMEINGVLLLVFPVPKCTNLWCVTCQLLRFTIREPRQVCLNWAGLWRVRTVKLPLTGRHWYFMDQLSKSRTKDKQAKWRTAQMPLAAHHWFSGFRILIPINFTMRPNHVEGKQRPLQKEWLLNIWPYVGVRKKEKT